MELEKKWQSLDAICQKYMSMKTLEDKKSFLLQLASTKEALKNSKFQNVPFKSIDEELVFLTILALSQEKVVFSSFEAMEKTLEQLVKVDRFYEAMGGLFGYYVKVLELLCLKQETNKKSYLHPPLFDLTKNLKKTREATVAGLKELPQMAEIYPIGGLGDRLNLRSETNDPMPTANLLFCGRTLLEGLIRDVSAREYLYYKIFSQEIFIPIAMMTSYEKENDRHIKAICGEKNWFDRPKESFYLFAQISVPVLTKNGDFSMKSPSQINLQPGGHGALWRTADEKGLFTWLQKQGIKKGLLRQINNPIAGLDGALLALVGEGTLEEKAFGFASCKRTPNAAEGVLVLTQDDNGCFAIVNIEYTDFKRYGIEETQDAEGYSLYPTNTNILYVDLVKLMPYLKENPYPGLVLNMKSEVPTHSGESVKGGRLESMMQSLSDALVSHEQEHIPTFVTYNERLKTISVTKRSYEEGKSLLETPPGAFYDLMQNAHDLLKRCGAEVFPLNPSEDYILNGPTLLFLYHPALGPLYEIICQKIRGGKFHKNAELQLEIAEIFLENLEVEGSCLIQATDLFGMLDDQGIRHYSQSCGRCILKNVTVKNKGIERTSEPLYWKNAHTHLERLRITLLGCSEFYAEDVTFEGDLEIVVPHNERWVARMSGDQLVFDKEKISAPTWHWDYVLVEGEVRLSSYHLLTR